MHDTGRSGALIWFGAIFAATIPFQLWRLAQHDATSWVAIDYLMRVAILLLLAAIPVVRISAFRTARLRIGWGELALWMLGIVIYIAVAEPAAKFLHHLVPDTELGGYPRTRGAAYLIDLTFGLLLTAAHEEIFFRRFARAAFQRFGDGALMVIVTSIVFALFHWWTGLPNIVTAGLAGAYLMLLYRRAGALWPCIAAHYAINFWYFL